MSGRNRDRRPESTPTTGRPKKPSHKGRHLLLSCCLFFAVLSACLITALVFIGKHYYYNNDVTFKQQETQLQQNQLLRLPRNIKPIHYDITLKPNLIASTFSGKVNITFHNSENHVKEIILHCKGLDVGEVELVGGGVVRSIVGVAKNASDEVIVVTVEEALVIGDYSLSVDYKGKLSERVGFYRSKYVRDNQTRYMATSKFEPTYARQAYPCFDEPNMKAKYTVRLLKPKDPSYIALSNMPKETIRTRLVVAGIFGHRPTKICSSDRGTTRPDFNSHRNMLTEKKLFLVMRYETEEEDGILVTFKESVPMSTYLSCFIVSDFLASEDIIKSRHGDIPLRVFATPAQLNKTQYALQASKKVMDYYLTYFKNPYPLPKLDMAAIPDFVSGAMEHWGLVTYRETALLYSPEISSTKNKERVVQVIAHELAHSWFGNLVTMDWWNDLWLNEGFASYMEYKGTDAAEPTWKKLEQFTISDLHPVLKLDATLASHPIVQTVTTPDQITEIFDTISYNKGAAILRMLENSVGDETFQEGVNNYLDKHKYGNAVTQDFLDEIQALVSKEINITDYINTWTIQMGYPVVDVQKIEGGYKLTQKRFLTDPSKYSKDTKTTPYNYRWTIPVTYITNLNKNKTQVWFKHNVDHVDIQTNADWIKFNPIQAGYYRTNYEMSEWTKLINRMDDFKAEDRTHLIEETFRLAESTMLPYEVPLDLTKYMKHELEYVPWAAAKTLLTEIKTYMMNSEYYTDFKAYLVKIVTPAYNNYTWSDLPDESFLTKLARITVIGLACSAGHPECMQEAHNKFKNWLDTNQKLSLDLKELIYKYGAESIVEEDWNKLWDIFVAESDAGEKLRLLRGLASVNNLSLLQKLINLAKDERYIRSQDYFTCLSYISYNPIGTALVWDYVREHWDELVERFTLNDRNLGKLIPTITKTFSTEVKKDEMLTFFEKYPDAGAGVTARAQALETVTNNINWLKNNKKSIEDWILANKDI